MKQLHKQSITLLRLALILGIILFNGLLAKPVVLAQGSAPIKAIRSVYTGEAGVPHPTGFAFLPQTKGFLLWGGAPGSSEVQLLEEYEDPAGALTLPAIAEAPGSVAFDSRSNRLFLFNNVAGELVELGLTQNGLPDTASENARRHGARSYGVQDPQGLTFDPASGRLFILDARGPQIISVFPDPATGFDADASAQGGRVDRLNLRGLGNAQLRGLAFNPGNGHLYVAAPSEQRVYEFDLQGEVAAVLDLASLDLTNIQSMTFAPSADTTDDAATMNLFILDGGASSADSQRQVDGQILELSLEPQSLPSGTTLLPSSLVRTFDTSNAAWTPSSPDPSGIDYFPLTGRLLIGDSEVDEMSNYFTGDNVFSPTLSGALASTCSTTNLSRTGFSNEPSGLAINPNNNRIYFTDDDKKSVFEVYVGPDNTYCTSDDVVTSAVLGLADGDDVAYGNNTLFIAAGVDAEVYKFSLGPNGVLGGGDDGAITHFDTGALGFSDLEGIGYNPNQNTLFIVSTSSGDRYLGEISLTGTLLRAYDLAYMGYKGTLRSDVAYVPSSQNPNTRSIYIVSRNEDNGWDPNENDGKVWEISLTSAPAQTPTNTALPTATFTPGATSTPGSNNAFLASFTGSGSAGSVSFADEDVIRFDGTSWSLFFDGSDVGLGGVDLTGFEVLNASTLLMAFNSSVTIAGNTYAPQDIIQFNATSLGATTAGTFSLYFDGSDVGIDASGEKIDSLHVLEDGRVLISTTANPAVPGLSGIMDEDVLTFTPTSLGATTSGSWAIYFDGSDVGLADTSNEDVDALDVTSNGSIYLSTLGDFAVSGVSGADEDVFVCIPSSIGAATACTYSPTLYLDGSSFGFASNGVDGFAVLASGPVPTAGPTQTPTNTPPATNTPTATNTAAPTATYTATNTPTVGPSPTNTSTPTSTNTPAPTFTPTATFTASPTSSASDQIFADSFESGSFSAWTTSATNGGNLNVSPSAALSGSYGMQVTFTNTTAMYARDDSPNAETHYRIGFLFDPNSITMSNGSYTYLIQGHDTSTNAAILFVQFYRSSAGYQLRVRAYDSGLGAWVNSPYATVSDAVHAVEIDWGNDGHVSFWVDGVQQANVTGINNSIYTIGSVRLGAAYLAGTLSGSYYIDAFQSRR